MNRQYEQLMLIIGAVTIAAAVVSAFLIGKLGGSQSSRLSFALIATFLLLIPPLAILFTW